MTQVHHGDSVTVCLRRMSGPVERSPMNVCRVLVMFRSARLRSMAIMLAGAISIGVVAVSGVVFVGRAGPSVSSSAASLTPHSTSVTSVTTTTVVPVRPIETAPTTTTEPAASPLAPVTSPAPVAVTSPAPAETPPPPVDASPASGCTAALAYLSAHANPAFALECPGNAFGRQAMTCAFIGGYCPDRQVIAIAVPCPAAYMNEAENSWIVYGLRPGPIDPYGYCQ
jgi:hypothetical protein